MTSVMSSLSHRSPPLSVTIPTAVMPTSLRGDSTPTSPATSVDDLSPPASPSHNNPNQSICSLDIDISIPPPPASTQPNSASTSPATTASSSSRSITPHRKDTAAARMDTHTTLPPNNDHAKMPSPTPMAVSTSNVPIADTSGQQLTPPSQPTAMLSSPSNAQPNAIQPTSLVSPSPPMPFMSPPQMNFTHMDSNIAPPSMRAHHEHSLSTPARMNYSGNPYDRHHTVIPPPSNTHSESQPSMSIYTHNNSQPQMQMQPPQPVTTNITMSLLSLQQDLQAAMNAANVAGSSSSSFENLLRAQAQLTPPAMTMPIHSYSPALMSAMPTSTSSTSPPKAAMYPPQTLRLTPPLKSEPMPQTPLPPMTTAMMAAAAAHAMSSTGSGTVAAQPLVWPTVNATTGVATGGITDSDSGTHATFNRYLLHFPVESAHGAQSGLYQPGKPSQLLIHMYHNDDVTEHLIAVPSKIAVKPTVKRTAKLRHFHEFCLHPNFFTLNHSDLNAAERAYNTDNRIKRPTYLLLRGDTKGPLSMIAVSRWTDDAVDTANAACSPLHIASVGDHSIAHVQTRGRGQTEERRRETSQLYCSLRLDGWYEVKAYGGWRVSGMEMKHWKGGDSQPVVTLPFYPIPQQVNVQEAVQAVTLLAGANAATAQMQLQHQQPQTPPQQQSTAQPPHLHSHRRPYASTPPSRPLPLYDPNMNKSKHDLHNMSHSTTPIATINYNYPFVPQPRQTSGNDPSQLISLQQQRQQSNQMNTDSAHSMHNNNSTLSLQQSTTNVPPQPALPHAQSLSVSLSSIMPYGVSLLSPLQMGSYQSQSNAQPLSYPSYSPMTMHASPQSNQPPYAYPTIHPSSQSQPSPIPSPSPAPILSSVNDPLSAQSGLIRITSSSTFTLSNPSRAPFQLSINLPTLPSTPPPSMINRENSALNGSMTPNFSVSLNSAFKRRREHSYPTEEQLKSNKRSDSANGRTPPSTQHGSDENHHQHNINAPQNDNNMEPPQTIHNAMTMTATN